MKTLTQQLKEQHQIERKLEPIEIEIAEFLNQKEIFNKIKESLKYQFEVRDNVTKNFETKLIPKNKNTYNLFIGIKEDNKNSDYKTIVSGDIKLNIRKNKLTFKTTTLKNNTFKNDDVVTVIRHLVGK
jgi:hypothetical protein